MSTYAPLPTGTPDGTKFYKDDGTWATPEGGTGGIIGVADDGSGGIVLSSDTAISDDGTGGINIAVGETTLTAAQKAHTHDVGDLDATGTPSATTYLRGDGSWATPAGGEGGVTDHGALTGLSDDDHTQYHTDARGDARYAPISGQFAVNTVAASGSTETLPATHAAHKVTMDEDCAFTFTAPTAGHAFVLHLLGAFTPTFPASVDWAGGTAPTYASGTLYHFVTVDGGTSWLGSGQAYS